MHLNVLGCGTIVPQNWGSNCSGYLIDDRLLIDCGPGIWHALCNERISIPGLEYILFTHFHVDHISDLGALLLTRYMSREKITGKLTLVGPPGLTEWYSNYKSVIGSWIDGLEIKIIELSGILQLSEYTITAEKTGHTENSICYRLMDQDGKIIFYSGDSAYHENVITAARNADLALIEASYLEENPQSGHLTPAAAAKIAARAEVKCLMLTHRYPEVTDSRAMADARKHYKGKILLARDGQKIVV